MKKSKKLLLTVLSVAMVAIIAVFGTVAYLQDEDSDVNVMTLGNVQIEQIEQERDANGNLVPFTQAKPLYPYVGEIAWNDSKININGHDYNMFGDKLKNAQDKIITVKNTGKSDAYVRTIVALEDPFAVGLLGVNVGGVGYSQTPWFAATIDGVQYSVTAFTYDKALKPNEETLPSFLQVYLKSVATNDDVAKLGETFDILAVSQAVQTNGFADAKTALNTAFGEVNAANVAAWFSGEEFAIPTVVDTAEELTAALAAGEDVVLNADVALEEDKTLTIAKGSAAQIDLNGHTLSSSSSTAATHVDAILVKGELTVENGTVEGKFEGTNMGWNGGYNVFDVTDGGVLNLENVTVKAAGTDMNFGVHLNNWGEVTLNANNCVFDSTYCGVRVFNSGPHMNNVTITNSTLKGATRAFWVHNYASSDFGGKLYSGASQAYDEAAVKARLNLDIYGNNNTFELSGTATSPIRYGFNATVYFDADGNVVQ